MRVLRSQNHGDCVLNGLVEEEEHWGMSKSIIRPKSTAGLPTARNGPAQNDDVFPEFVF